MAGFRPGFDGAASRMPTSFSPRALQLKGMARARHDRPAVLIEKQSLIPRLFNGHPNTTIALSQQLRNHLLIALNQCSSHSCIRLSGRTTSAFSASWLMIQDSLIKMSAGWNQWGKPICPE